MKREIEQYIEHAKQRVKEKSMQSTFGLAISVHPKETLDFLLTGVISIQGAPFQTEENANETFHAHLANDWFKGEDTLGATTIAQIQKSFFITIEENNTQPITITQNDCSAGIFILAKKNTQANILITSTGKSTLRLHLIAQEKANITITHIIQGQHIAYKYAKPQNDATVNWNDVILTDKYVRVYTTNKLQHTGATGNIVSLSFAKENAICDMYTENSHQAKNTFSDIKTRSVITDNAKTLSRGLVQIQENAYGSNGYEQQDALLLSDDAEADAIPNLEIHNHDVKCSHGSTVGKVDENKLFYLMSRGLNEKQAKQKIIEGYFTPILDMYKQSDIKEQIETMLETTMGED